MMPHCNNKFTPSPPSPSSTIQILSVKCLSTSVANLKIDKTKKKKNTKLKTLVDSMADDIVVHNTFTHFKYSDIKFINLIASTNMKDVCKGRIFSITEEIVISIIKKPITHEFIHVIDKIPHHKNICRVFGVFLDPLCVVMDAVRGMPLSEYIKTKDYEKLDLIAKIMIIRSIASGVEAMHYCGVAHRDLKSANILIDSNLIPILIDFDTFNPLLGDCHDSNKLIGTLKNAAPEVLLEIDGREAFKADVYSLSLIFFEVLTGKEAYPNETVTSIMNLVATGQLRPIWNISDEYSLLIQLTERCWRNDPLDRPTASTVIGVLTDIVLGKKIAKRNARS